MIGRLGTHMTRLLDADWLVRLSLRGLYIKGGQYRLIQTSGYNRL